MFVDNAISGSVPFKIDSDIKEKWVCALRSGEYNQTQSQLHNSITGGYCCLGVLAKLTGMQMDINGHGIVNEHGVGEGYGPLRAIIGSEKIIETLWMMNDGHGNRSHSFNEIADFIETNL